MDEYWMKRISWKRVEGCEEVRGDFFEESLARFIVG